MTRRLPVLTEEQWRAILVAAAPVMPPDLKQARIEVEECLDGFLGVCSLNAADLKRWRKLWQRIDKLVDELGRALRQIPRRSPWGDYAQVQQDIASLNPLRERAHVHVEGFTISVRGWAGKQDPVREWLYWRLMGVWTNTFRGQLALATSTSSSAAPGSPLIRFLHKATEVALEIAGEHLAPNLGGDPPNVHALRDAVRRERRRRKGKY